MNSDILFEKDMLYPTDSVIEPGSINIKVYGPDKDVKLPVVIESKSNHSPLKYIDVIVRIMQSDIFDRLMIDIKKNVDIYICTSSELSTEYGNHNYIKVNYSTDGIIAKGAEL